MAPRNHAACIDIDCDAAVQSRAGCEWSGRGFVSGWGFSLKLAAV
ncbi:MAG: hypothetical protein VB858_05485 [Planctomycetaceae bacterium]